MARHGSDVLFTRNSIPLPALTFTLPLSEANVISPAGLLLPAWTIFSSAKS